MQHPSTARHVRSSTCTARLALLAWAALGLACQKETPKAEQKTAAAQPTAEAKAKPAAAKAEKPKPKRLEWDDPKGWKRVPPSSSMRLASYQIPPVAGDKEIAELNVFVLGGDVDANIQRWIDEFSGFDPKTLARTDRTVNGIQESVVEIPKGRFSGGMGDDMASENFGLLGGIAVTPEGSKYFFKLTGPSETVKAARGAFYGLLDSVRLEGGTAAPQSAQTVKTIGGAASPAAAGAPGKTDTAAPAGKASATTGAGGSTAGAAKP